MTAVLQHGQTLISEREWVTSPHEASAAVTSTRGTTSEVAEKIFGSSFTPTPTRSDQVVLRVTPVLQARLERAIETMQRFGGLQSDWDSYGAGIVQPDAVLQALRLLAVVFNTRKDIPDPMIVPTSEGGVQLEWDRDGLHLELEVRPSLEVDVYWERPDGETWGGLLQNNQESLLRFLQRLD
ncbi:MAG: hypothetical protein ACSLFB_04795 [Acidimicrobiales bacterium]